jgi:hypothetical protein
MILKDEQDYLKETSGDLRARLMAYQTFSKVLLTAYDALLNWGVNFKSLPEWQDMGDLDEAVKLKPDKGAEKTTGWLIRLEHAIQAAVRRKQFSLTNKPKKD